MSKDLQPISETSTALAVPSSTHADLDLGDIVLPKIILQHGQSQLVDAGVAKKGDLMLGASADDIGAVKLTGFSDEPVKMYILSTQKTAAIFRTGEAPDFAAAHGRRDPNDPDSWDVFFYQCYIPGVEEDLPARWMLAKTAARPAYQAINTLRLRAENQGDTDPICIMVKTVEKSNRGGIKYSSYQVSAGTPDPAELEQARKLQQRAITLNQARRYENDAPSEPAPEQPAFS